MSTKNTAPVSPFMTLPELQMHYAGCSRSFIYNAVQTGELPAPTKLGGKILFERAAILRFDAERQARAEQATAARRDAMAVA
jgi:excisionase family DNA binding protein